MKLIQSLMLLLFIGLPLGAIQAAPDMDDVTMEIVPDDDPSEVMHDIDLPDDADLEGRDDHGTIDDDDDHGPGHMDDDENENEDEMENEDEREDEREDGQPDDGDDGGSRDD